MAMTVLGYVGGKKLYKRQPGNIKRDKPISEEEYEKMFLSGE